MKRSTIKDIATLIGVSPSTVSRALKDHPDIGVPLKQEIKRVAEELNYHPNYNAVNLRQQRTNKIGVIIPEFTLFFFPSVIRGITAVTEAEGFQLMVMQCNESAEKEIQNVRICCDNCVDGIIISLSNQTKDLTHLFDAKEFGIPTVIFDKTIDHSGFDEVLIDDEAAASICVHHLIKTGCINIGGVFGNENMSITQKRITGFQKVMQKFNLPVDGRIKYANNSGESITKTEELIHEFNIDGIFGMSDEVLTGIIPAVKRMNKNIPDDVSIICMSDGVIPNFFEPAVTYLHHSGFEVGKNAAIQLVAHIKNTQENFPPERKILDIKLVTQGSTKKIIERIY
jgi:LacI family transcriptional regulator